MLLWVIRHADAVRSTKLDDDARPLSALGMTQARRLARYFHTRLQPTAIWSSPLVRARQTAETIAEAVPSATLRIVEALAPGSSVREIIHEVDAAPPSACVLVGHEPTMSALVSRLLSGDDSTHVRFAPSTTVLLEAETAIRAGECRLLECLSPDLLETLFPTQAP